MEAESPLDLEDYNCLAVAAGQTFHADRVLFEYSWSRLRPDYLSFHDTGIALSEDAWKLIAAERYDLIRLDATMGKKTTGWRRRDGSAGFWPPMTVWKSRFEQPTALTQHAQLCYIRGEK